MRLAAELFPDAGPRLTARLADVCVLPAPGRMAWLRPIPSRQLRFKGHHGGRTPEESETWVGLRHDAGMESGVSFAALDPDTEERFVPLRRMLGVTSFGLNQIVLRPGQRGRIHRHRDQEEVYLVLSGTLTLVIEREVRELGAGRARPRRARGAPLHRQPRRGGRRADRARRLERARRPRRRGVRATGTRRRARRRRRSRCPPDER